MKEGLSYQSAAVERQAGADEVRAAASMHPDEAGTPAQQRIITDFPDKSPPCTKPGHHAYTPPELKSTLSIVVLQAATITSG